MKTNVVNGNVKKNKMKATIISSAGLVRFLYIINSKLVQISLHYLYRSSLLLYGNYL